MITKITGVLRRLDVTEAYVEVGAFEYQVLIPGFVRRQLQAKVGESVTPMTIQYIDGNPQKGGRMVPGLSGFSIRRSGNSLTSFAVDGVGVKKALQAMVRPVRDVATCIEEQDTKGLQHALGIGPAVAERIIAKLRRKMAKFALLIEEELLEEKRSDRDVINEGYEALIALGHSNVDAREKIEQALKEKGKFKTVEELLQQIYSQQRS